MIASTLGFDSQSTRQGALSVIRTVRQAQEKMNMPTNIQKAGVNETEFLSALDAMAEKALNDPCTAANVQPATIDDIKDIYKKAYYGRY